MHFTLTFRTVITSPVLFDFDKPTTRNTIETVTTIARLARFILADITDPRSVPHELATLVPSLPSVPVQPLIGKGAEPWGMYDSIKVYPWVRPIWTYEDKRDLVCRFETEIVASIEAGMGI